MIGLFDSGHGGLTIFKALSERFPGIPFVYLGDHLNAPYGDRPSEEVVVLTRLGVEALFDRGCGLVLLACNTATSVACRILQQEWLPNSKYNDHNVLGIIAPTVEAATQTPWSVTSPRYPQMYNRDRIAIFGTTRTITTDVYGEEIRKRCPEAQIYQMACPDLAGAIEEELDEELLDRLVSGYTSELLSMLDNAAPHQAILGCTHYPLVEHLFRRHLPMSTRILSQPNIVANSLEHYLRHHAHFDPRNKNGEERSILLTTGLDTEPMHDAMAHYRAGLCYTHVVI